MKQNPEVHISVSKNRLRVYDKSSKGDKQSGKVFLQNGSEFEFEFFNPTQDNLKVRIEINGKSISKLGVILRPGARGWLERYIDEDRKFLFETYKVEKSKEVAKAIENNGLITVSFYREKEIVESPVCLDSFDSNETLDCSCSFASVPVQASRDILRTKSKKKSLTETGRVEKGGASGQKFTLVDMKFYDFPSTIIEYKLLPESQKVKVIGEAMKTKCSNCGMKLKTNWKICPVCETPVKDECQCGCCGFDLEPKWKVCPMCTTPIK